MVRGKSASQIRNGANKRKRQVSTEEQTSSYFSEKSQGNKSKMRRTRSQKKVVENLGDKEKCEVQIEQKFQQSEHKGYHDVKYNDNVEEMDFLFKIYQKKQTLRASGKCNTQIIPGRPVAPSSVSIVHSLYQTSLGMRWKLDQRKAVQNPVTQMVSDMVLYRTASPFDRRCTSLEWHPMHQNLLAVGSKGGDIILWDTDKVNNDHFIRGRGPGGNVSAMKFDPSDPTKLYTATLDGKVALQDFNGKHTKVFLDTMSWESWYCGVDVNQRRHLVVAGDNVGNMTLLSLDGQKLWSNRLHKQKVTHVEFSPREDWLLCSASVDNTVQLWDVRMVKDRKSALSVLKHDKPVNSAYFSLTDGTRLLTTDQHHELRVYRSPDFRLESTINHPHRFFQHITPIKAHWHPLVDLMVVGRYPDPNLEGYKEGEKRTIDVYDANSGHMTCQLQDPAAPGIVSLNKFSPHGDRLASTMGVNILIWTRKEEAQEKQASLMNALKEDGITPGRGGGRRRGGGATGGKGKGKMPDEGGKKKQKSKDTTQVKLKLKTQTKQSKR